jgi:hypothetical protein
MMELSRRSVLAGSAVLAVVPLRVDAREIAAVSNAVFDLRGVRVGEHAILRTSGTVSSETRTWRFAENTLVSWTARGGEVLERREGRIQLTAADGRTIEISTGPVGEVIDPDAPATILNSGGASRLLVSAATLTPSDAWDLLENGPLPAGVSEFRMFTAADADTRTVSWGLRSPWLADLGTASSATRLIWRGTGRLSAWRGV